MFYDLLQVLVNIARHAGASAGYYASVATSFWFAWLRNLAAALAPALVAAMSSPRAGAGAGEGGAQQSSATRVKMEQGRGGGEGGRRDGDGGEGGGGAGGCGDGGCVCLCGWVWWTRVGRLVRVLAEVVEVLPATDVDHALSACPLPPPPAAAASARMLVAALADITLGTSGAGASAGMHAAVRGDTAGHSLACNHRCRRSAAAEGRGQVVLATADAADAVMETESLVEGAGVYALKCLQVLAASAPSHACVTLASLSPSIDEAQRHRMQYGGGGGDGGGGGGGGTGVGGVSWLAEHALLQGASSSDILTHRS